MNGLLQRRPPQPIAKWVAPALCDSSCGRDACASAGAEGGVAPLAAYHIVSDVARRHPETIEVMVGLGFAPVRFGALRRTFLKRVTLAQAAAHARVPLAQMLHELNERIDASEADRGGRHGCCETCAGVSAGCGHDA